MEEKKEYSNTPQIGEIKKTQIDNNELFMIVNREDNYYVGILNNLISKRAFKTPEEAQEYIDRKPWELIFNVAGVIAEYALQEKVTEIAKKLGVSTGEPVKK